MIPARADPHQVHFKKRWLTQERALSLSAETSDQAAAMIRPYASPAKEEEAPRSPLVPFACPASPSTATNDPSSSFQFAADRPAASLRRHAAAPDSLPSIFLSIPRFPKYGAHAPLLAQCSTASSTLCSPDSPAAPPVASPAADHPHSWLLRAASSDAETCKPQVGAKRGIASQPSVSTERFMIDINKPPPSPEAHDLDSAVTPSNTCSAASADLPGLPRAYGMAVMDYSFSDLNASTPSWLTSASGGGDSRRAATPSTRKGPHAQSALLHLPNLRGGLPAAASRRGPAEPAKRQPGLSLSLPDQEASPPPPFAAPSQLQQKQSPPARHLARPGSNGAAAACQGPSAGRRSSPTVPSQTPSPVSLRKPRSHWPITGALLGHSRHVKAESEEPEQGEEEEEEEEHEEEEEEEEEEGEIVARRGSGSEEEECASRGGSPKACLHCNTTKTPLWRNGPPGPKSLCNACGIRFNKIRSGKRKPTPKEAAMLLKYERSGSTVTGLSDVSASSSPDRSSSKAAGLRGEKRQAQGKGGAETEAERKLVQSLPVAGAHKSRSKMQRQNSTGGRAHQAGAPAVKVALFGGRKRSPESDEGYAEEEGEDEEEGRPLGLAFRNRGKRACLAGYGYAAGGPKGPSFSRSVSPAEDAVVLREGDSSSSDHESCLSEPGQSPPESPRGVWKAQRGLMLSKARYGPGVPPALMAQGPGDEADAEDGLQGSDVEVGARLLMEIFHSSSVGMY